MEKKREWIRLEGRCRVEDGISRQFVPNCPCTRLFSYFTLIFLTFCDFFFSSSHCSLIHTFSLTCSHSYIPNQKCCSWCLFQSASKPDSKTELSLFTVLTHPLVCTVFLGPDPSDCVGVCMCTTDSEEFTATSWFVSKHVCVMLHTSQAGSAGPTVCVCVHGVSVCNIQ